MMIIDVDKIIQIGNLRVYSGEYIVNLFKIKNSNVISMAPFNSGDRFLLIAHTTYPDIEFLSIKTIKLGLIPSMK